MSPDRDATRGLRLRRLEPGITGRQAATGADPAAVAELIAAVRANGDVAVATLTERFDRVSVPELVLGRDALQAASLRVGADVRADLERAHANVRRVAEAQRAALVDLEVEVEPGVHIGQRWLPVERVACYVPGGRYPLPSTVIMTVTPARAAGVAEVVVLSPPGPHGAPHDAILAAAAVAGADAVYVAGGVQAVAAAAWGTERLPAVDLIVGPGNAWVTEAKRQAFGAVGIDALAGPSEVVVLADASADATRVAADLLAQAEHDPHAIAVLVTDDLALAAAVDDALTQQLSSLPTAAIARAALEAHGGVVVVADRAAMIAEANVRAPEHLHLHLRDVDAAAQGCRHFGGLFIGEDAAEVFGDYCAGGNHVLPTAGAARYGAGLSVHTFLRPLATQRLTRRGAASLAGTTARLARVEGLEAHARAAELRRG